VKWQSRCLTGLAFGSRCNSCSIKSLGTPSMSADFHAKMSLFSYRNLMSTNSYLGSKLLPTSATLEGSSMDNRIVLLSVSSSRMDVLEVLNLGMTGSGGDSTKACFSSLISANANSLSAVSLLFLSQSKARLMSPLMEMTPHGPSIFKTK
jgi:hypothetical protein